MVLDILSISLKREVGGSVQREIKYLLVNSNISSRNSEDWSSVTDNGELVKEDGGGMVFEVQGWNGLPISQYLNKKPIIVQLSTVSSGPFGINSKAFIGDKGGGNTIGYPPAAPSRGINSPYPTQTINGELVQANSSNYNVSTFLPDVFRQGNGPNGTNLSSLESSYNGIFNIDLSSWNDNGSGIQNDSYNGTSISPSPLTVLLVDLPNVSQINNSSDQMINDSNNAITITWTNFPFCDDSNFDQNTIGDVFWTITKIDEATGQGSIILNNKVLSGSGGKYSFQDTNVRIYDKLKYSISGEFKWFGIQNLLPGSAIPSITINGFTTPICFACKFNRFTYGRFNTTSTNLKLFRPLLINTPQGQVDQYGQKTCGGGCNDPSDPNLRLFSGTTRISSNNNIYANTTNQLSKKQTYVLLSKSRFRPFR